MKDEKYFCALRAECKKQENNTNCVDVFCLAEFLTLVSRKVEACEQRVRAAELSPTDYSLVVGAATALRLLDRKNDAEAWYRMVSFQSAIICVIESILFIRKKCFLCLSYERLFNCDRTTLEHIQTLEPSSICWGSQIKRPTVINKHYSCSQMTQQLLPI